MTELLDNIHLFLPQMIILATACLVLLADLFLKKNDDITLMIASCGLLLSAVICVLYLGHYQIILLHGMAISDDMALLMNLFIALSVLACFIYSNTYMKERHMPVGDVYVLGLFSTLGMMLLVCAHSLLTIYLGLELLSLPLYAMTAVQRRNGDSSEAAMKYFVMGSIASGLLLYGMSLFYGATGNLELTTIAQALTANGQYNSGLVVFALVFVMSGVAFKMAAAPFHMWVPDVYVGAPTSVTLFLGAAPKIAAVAMALRLLTIALPDVLHQWQNILLVMAILSTGIGNLVAIVQTNIKRLLAYSAISHLGYVIFGLLAATPAGYAAALFYVLIYSITSVAAFGFLVLLSHGGVEIETIDELKGMNQRNPWLALMMMIIMFSMAGIPPMVGFFTKLLVLKALIDVHMVWVAVVGLLFAVIGAFYYLRVIKTMYFDEPKISAPIQFPAGVGILFSFNCLSLVYFGLFPGALIALCMNAFSG